MEPSPAEEGGGRRNPLKGWRNGGPGSGWLLALPLSSLGREATNKPRTPGAPLPPPPARPWPLLPVELGLCSTSKSAGSSKAAPLPAPREGLCREDGGRVPRVSTIASSLSLWGSEEAAQRLPGGVRGRVPPPLLSLRSRHVPLQTAVAAIKRRRKCIKRLKERPPRSAGKRQERLRRTRLPVVFARQETPPNHLPSVAFRGGKSPFLLKLTGKIPAGFRIL